MIYFTPHEHALACISYLLLGAFFGVLYRSLNTLFDFLSNLLFLGIDAVKSHSPLSCKKIKRNKKHRHILDFLFFLSLGITFILFSYATLDGEIRIYNVLILIISFLIFERFFSLPIEYVLRFSFEKIYSVVFFIVYWVLLPMRWAFSLLKKLILPHISRIKYAIYKRSFASFVTKECAAIEKIILEIK